MACEPARIGLADMANPERKEEAVEGDGASCVDGGEEVVRRGLAEPFPFPQGRAALPVARLEGEDVGRRADEAFAKKSSICFSPSPSMSNALREHEVLEALDRLRRTDERPGAAAHDVRLAGLFVDLTQRRRAADGADDVSLSSCGNS